MVECTIHMQNLGFKFKFRLCVIYPMVLVDTLSVYRKLILFFIIAFSQFFIIQSNKWKVHDKNDSRSVIIKYVECDYTYMCVGARMHACIVKYNSLCTFFQLSPTKWRLPREIKKVASRELNWISPAKLLNLL